MKEIRENKIEEVISALEIIEKDQAVSKNVRECIKNSMQALRDDSLAAVKVNRSLQELEELSDNPNIPGHTRTQLWTIVSLLESV